MSAWFKKFLSVLLLAAFLPSAVFAAPENTRRPDKKNPEQKIKLPHLEFELAPGVKLKMVWIKGGAFMMGSPDSELGRWHEPQRKVVITRPYYIAVYAKRKVLSEN